MVTGQHYCQQYADDGNKNVNKDNEHTLQKTHCFHTFSTCLQTEDGSCDRAFNKMDLVILSSTTLLWRLLGCTVTCKSYSVMEIYDAVRLTVRQLVWTDKAPKRYWVQFCSTIMGQYVQVPDLPKGVRLNILKTAITRTAHQMPLTHKRLTLTQITAPIRW